MNSKPVPNASMCVEMGVNSKPTPNIVRLICLRTFLLAVFNDHSPSTIDSIDNEMMRSEVLN